jgi:hypothetical protein
MIHSIHKIIGRPTGLILFALLTVLCCPTSLQAQQYLGTLTGTVEDASGAKIVSADVTATDVVTKFVTKTVTNGSGGYSIPFLTPGTYTVTISSTSFRGETRTDIMLTAGQNVQINFSLKAGSVAENVVVTADTVLLDTASSNLSETLTSKEVTDIPNIGRNPFQLATLAPGMTSTNYTEAKASFGANPWTLVAAKANGNSGHFRLTLDGIPDDPAERFTGAGYQGFVPSPEAVQEVKTQTAVYDAQYGHGDGTVINTVLRTGSNQFHGSAYFIFRNTYLNANTSERVPNQNSALNAASPTPRVNDQWRQPGFVFDGPIVIPKLYDGHDKTFFMVAYERIQSVNNIPYSALLPTAAERAGNFSDLCTSFASGICAAGKGQQIYDPLTSNSANNRTPFLGNIIPANRMSAVGAALSKFYPTPNSTLSRTVNYISPETVDHQKYFGVVARLDHSFSQNNKASATFFNGGISAIQPNEGFGGGVGPTGIGYTVYRNNEGGSLDDVIVVSPTLVVDARVGVIYHPFNLVYLGNKYDLSTIGINATGLPYASLPGTSFTDSYGGLQSGAGSQESRTAIGAASLLISKSFGKHNLRTGYEGNLIRYNVQNPESGLGTFAFNRQFTQQNSVNTAVGNDPNSGNAVASLILGYPSSGNYLQSVSFALQQLYSAFYVQDDWRVTNRLTLNMGLRWDYESPFTERYNRQNAGFCTACANPLQASVSGLALNGGLQFVSASNRYPYPKDLNNFQPRFGIEFQLSPSTVLRGGFGVIYFNTLETPLGQGYNSTTAYVSTLDSSHPANVFSNPFPSGINQPTGSSLGLATQVGQSVSFSDPNHTQPKTIQYSVSTQTQLPAGIVLQVAYVGNKASQTEINKNINGIPAQYYNQGAAGVTYLQQQVPNPMVGLLSGSSLNSATIQRQFLLTPFPEFTGVTDNYASKGSTLYNSLQTSVTKRMSHHFSVQGNFTWSKTMDRDIYLNPGQDSLDNPFRYEDPSSTLVANVVSIYQFSGLEHQPAYLRMPLGGWQINGVLRAQNGNLIASPSGVTPLAPAHLANATYGRFFNTCYENAAGALVMATASAPGCDSASSTPAFQQHLSFTLNNIGPYMSDVRQRIHPLFDLSLFKRFEIHESANFEIRGEFFNLLNTPIFAGPNTTPGSANYGAVTLTQINDPRIAQLTARINF